VSGSLKLAFVLIGQRVSFDIAFYTNRIITHQSGRGDATCKSKFRSLFEKVLLERVLWTTNQLTLTLAPSRLKWGKPHRTLPSRFLYEMTGHADNPRAARPKALLHTRRQRAT
jgi:hypothetical protein